MVFESIVADLLNKYLSQYVENLDRTQLKIGIWGGDVVLKNLMIKSGALDELNLPLKIVYGEIGKLVLKIPWKNLYGSSVEASVDSLFMLAVPSQDIKYDGEKEERWAQEAKQAEILRVEIAKQQERLKDQPKSADTFTEKLAAQIIRNVQIRINSIHIRYEDQSTRPERPFSCGLTLFNLSVVTTDQDWKPHVSSDASTMIYKLLTLEGFAFYWNPKTFLISKQNMNSYPHYFQEGIATHESLAKGYRYVLGPINSTAKLRISPKPELDNFSLPKYLLELDLQRLQIRMSKEQYRDAIKFMASIELMVNAAPYRKYRPNLKEYIGHEKVWWHFAYKCILEETVRRKRRNWDWDHIKAHRNICREYAHLYTKKLTAGNKMSGVENLSLTQCENELDAFNIILVRQKVENDIERLGRLAQVKKANQAASGWFSSWWSAKETDAEAEDEIIKKFEEAMNAEEKQKLYRAIDYQENATPAIYPVTFNETEIQFMLHSFEVEIRDEILEMPRVLTVVLKQVQSFFQQRPAAKAFKLVASIDTLSVFGLTQNNEVPLLVSSKKGKLPVSERTSDLAPSNNLFHVLIETNPLDKKCDQRVHISSTPLQIVYDAQTIIKLNDVFTPEKAELDVATVFSAAATVKIAEFKERSSLGFQYTLEKHGVLELKIELMASYCLIPHGGHYTGHENMIVVNLGRISIYSRPPDGQRNIQEMRSRGQDDETILQEMMSSSYDRFDIKLDDLQVMVVYPEEKWQMKPGDNAVPGQHLLRPTSVIVLAQKCVVTDDPNLPKLKLNTELPSVEIKIAEGRLLNAAGVLISIPFPDSETPAPVTEVRSTPSKVNLRTLDFVGNKKKVDKKSNKELVQLTELEVKFELKELIIQIDWQKYEDDPPEPLVLFNLRSLGFEMVQQTFNLHVNVVLKSLQLIQYYEGDEIKLLSTTLADDLDHSLFLLKYVNVNRNSPVFETHYHSVIQLVEMSVSKLDATIKQDAILFILQWWNHVQEYLLKLKDSNSTLEVTSSTSEEKAAQLSLPQQRQLTPMVSQTDELEREIVMVKLIACLNDFLVTIHSEAPLFEFDLAGLNVLLVMKPQTTEMDASLSNISIIDLMGTEYNRNMLSIMEERDVIVTKVVLYENKKESLRELSDESFDVAVSLSMACVRIIFVNERLMEFLAFLNNFQAGKEAIVEASAAAVQTAKLNMQQAYENATKVSLDVRLNAPVIVVPVSFKSRHALILDLGHLTINNNVTSQSSNSCLIDNMKLDLQQMKMSSAILRKGLGTKDEASLLLPINFTLVVKRNLSISWCKDVPDLDITGHFQAIKMSLSQQAYSLILSVIEGNLAASPKSSKPSVPAPKPTISNFYETAKFNISRQKLPIAFDKDEEATMEDGSFQDMLARSVIKFKFDIDSMELNLSTNSKKVDPKTGNSVDDLLAKLSLNTFALEGSVFSDNSISFSILLRDCLIDDLRLSRKKLVPRYMERNRDPRLDDSNDMINLLYSQKDQLTSINVEVSSFILMFNLDFCLKLLDFFTQKQDKKPTPAISSAKVGAVKAAPDMKKKKSTTLEPEDIKLEAKDNRMSVSVHVQQPDIILVENMVETNTRGIVLNFEMNYQLQMTGATQTMSGWVRDLQIYSCFFTLEKKKTSLALVLRPVNVSLSGEMPEPNNLQIEVETTPVRLSVSPATIELLNRIKQTINTNLADEEPVMPENVDLSDLWDIKPINENEFWFLKAEEAQEAIAEVPKLLAESAVQVMQEACTVSIPSIIITIEAGVGTKTLPMLLLESKLNGTFENWSSAMKIASCLTLEVKYYNSRLALWEPFIEPIEYEEPNSIESSSVPWELNFKMETKNPNDTESSDKVSNNPLTKIDISSKELMQITVSKTCLQVCQDLGKAFRDAVSNEGPLAMLVAAPYTLKNFTGLSVTLILGLESFKIQDLERKNNEEIVILESGAEISLFLPDDDSNSVTNSASYERNLRVLIPDKNYEIEIPVVQAVKRYYTLLESSQDVESCHLISEVLVENGSTSIILRSVMQIYNHFSVPINVYALAASGDQLELIGVVEPDAVFNVPIPVLSSTDGDIFFRVRGYSVCSKSYKYDLTQPPSAQMLQCVSKNPEDSDPFFIKAVGSSEKVYYESTSRYTTFSRSHSVHLWPTLYLRNLLPVDVVVVMQGVPTEKLLPSGKKMDLPNVEPGSSSIIIRIVNYLEKEWSCKRAIDEKPPELDAWIFYSYDSAQRMSLQLGMRSIIRKDAFYMVLYSPFWMINKTDMKLAYRSSEECAKTIYHPASFKQPIMFSREKSFFNKTKASVKINNGEWCDKFLLDVAGNVGMLTCTVKGVTYQIGVHIKMMSNSLTKLVTFTPYYVIINKCWFDINFRQVLKGNEYSWEKVESKTCHSFWPHQSKHTSTDMILRVDGTEETTTAFSFTKIMNNLLRLENSYGGINVDIQVMESATYITLDYYKAGFAPAYIVNHTNYTFLLSEKHSTSGLETKLPASSAVMFTWCKSQSFDSPILSINDGIVDIDVRKDALGTFVLKSKEKGFWVSFLNGMQRTIFLTTDENMAKEAEAVSDLDQIDQEIIISLHGIGLSLVNNELKQEICYLTMTSSGPYWQLQKEGNKRFKSLTIEESRNIEDAFMKYSQVGSKPLTEGKKALSPTSDGKFQIDFSNQTVSKPFKGKLRRIYHVGLWLQTKSSLHTYQVHAKINHLQIDNQGHTYTFPVIFAPQPLAKTTAASQSPKPFAELSIVQRLYDYSTFKQYKYFKILIQEMQVKVDVVFISALTNLFKVDSMLMEDQELKFEEDRKVMNDPLYQLVTCHSSEEAKNYYDFLHFGPIKLHLSFSFSSGFDNVHEDTAENINILTQSFGVTVTDFNDVVIKLSYLERQYVMLNQRQLEHEVMSHYTTQFIRQIYVVVFGLDVLGNPYKLVTDIKRGVQDFFYEPIQGAIQGPGEFAEGVVLGMKSLFGHTVGGAAGAVSRITGSLGHGLAALTFDKDYQQKRRENVQKRSAHERIATSSKGLVMGVVEGVGGVFTKPISGARAEGFGGFMKGIGIGVAGLITRPTGGLVDFASGSFRVVRDVMEVTKDATRVRLPRYFKEDKVVRPYSRKEAEGYVFLFSLDKGKFAKTDTYVFHMYIDKNKRKEVFLITNNRVLYSYFNDVFGSVELLWAYSWAEFDGPPVARADGLLLPLKSKGHKLSRSQHGKLLLVEDEELKAWLAAKITELMEDVDASSVSFSSSLRR
ncbi:unnamed protein product [Bemisia tabaci]|uniref:Vacuolar protein sorting-associated protein 13A n=2 Tax=Bemisia tabaci TaxID=7038 RepID=A0A9P0AKV2_BEMTA|nr:unnamed protein product [Bemisia tabaci]